MPKSFSSSSVWLGPCGVVVRTFRQFIIFCAAIDKGAPLEVRKRTSFNDQQESTMSRSHKTVYDEVTVDVEIGGMKMELE
jgi:hypothetical protein